MFDFPASPTVGQQYPASPPPGVPSYYWDGEKWKTNNIRNRSSAATTPPVMDSVAAPGTAAEWTRGDHTHPSDTSRVPSLNANFTGTLTAAAWNASGNFTIGGVINAANTAKGHKFGSASGTNYSGALLPTDANLLLYDPAVYGTENWAGIGTDTNGVFWIRTGYDTRWSAAFIADTNQVCSFANSPTAPSPPGGDNSYKLATTAWVVANQPVGGPYLPLTGGTITGNLRVSYGHIMPYRGDSTGVLYFSNGATLDRYLYYNGANYYLNQGSLYTAAGRIHGDGDWTRPVSSARIGGHAGDYFFSNVSGLAEPYGGAVSTGSTGSTFYTGVYGHTMRFRYNQIYVEGTWYTAGYA